MAAKYAAWSAYNYVVGNPIKFIDADGREVGDPVNNPQISNDNQGKNHNRYYDPSLNRGTRSGGARPHWGIDIFASKGTPLQSVLGGVVVRVRDDFAPGRYKKNSTGNTIMIKSEVDGKVVYLSYGHLDKVDVKDKQIVKAGEVIGQTGNTGNAAGVGEANYHVHIQAYEGGTAAPNRDTKDPGDTVNPEKYLTTKFDKDGNAIPTGAAPTITPPDNVLYTPPSNFPETQSKPPPTKVQ